MTTLAKLNLDQIQYEEMIFGLYARWCESVTINHKQFQTVLANAMVNKWFILELLKCEEEFHNSTDCFAIEFHDIVECHRMLAGPDIGEMKAEIALPLRREGSLWQPDLDAPTRGSATRLIK